MKKPHKKPTGIVGHIEIYGDDREPEFKQVKFPERKFEVEDMIVSNAISKSSPLWDHYLLNKEPAQNEEQDFDYTFNTINGIEYLDLMELAILGKAGYADAPFEYNHGKLADAVVDGIRKKSIHYGKSSNLIHLMIYSTDIRFNVGNNVLWLISKYCAEQDHNFKSIVYLAFLSTDSLDGKILFPSDLNFGKYGPAEIENIRNRKSILGNLAQFQHQGDNIVVVPLGKGKKNGKKS